MNVQSPSPDVPSKAESGCAGRQDPVYGASFATAVPIGRSAESANTVWQKLSPPAPTRLNS